MSKKKEKTTEGTELTETKKVYDFTPGRRCPACGGTDTEAVSTQGHVQYRHCRRIGCGHHHKNYTVMGKEV